MEGHQSGFQERSEPEHKPRNVRNRNRGYFHRHPRNNYSNSTDAASLPDNDFSNIPQGHQHWDRQDYNEEVAENMNAGRHKKDSYPHSNYTNYATGSQRRNPTSRNHFPSADTNVHEAPTTEINGLSLEEKLPKSKHGYNPRNGKHNNNQKTNRREYEETNVNLTEPETNAPRHGQIVGGRYIRKHSNQSTSQSHNYRSAEGEGSVDDVQSYRSRGALPENSRKINKGFSNVGQRKMYSERDDNSARRRPNYGPVDESAFSVTDVYHYSSQNINEQRFRKPANQRSASSHVATTYKENDATQRELLMQRLNKGDCECLVCCEQIRVKDQTWHCLSCFHVFHLRCIRKWARSPAAVVEDGGWRCPACQSLTEKVPYDYMCFCGKSKNPDVNYHLTPHSCGEICGRKRPDCSHLCKELCHPGPCPPCAVVVQKSCACGKTFKTTSCNHSVEETCASVCDKSLNCGVHTCKSQCHPGQCAPCEELVVQNCHCGKHQQTVSCTKDTASVSDFSCGGVCGKQLKCGNHSCSEVCHSGDCDPCSLSTEVVKDCPCGKSSIEMLVAYGKTLFRKSCKDPIPLCGGVCEKVLFCGPKSDPHKCQSLCHEGECGKCPLSTSLKCRCGAFTKVFSCADVTPDFQFLCEKRCNRRKECGRHKCLNNCCVSLEHRCELVCNKKLSCGLHQCVDSCHMGNCPTCWNVSFDELRCYCGEAVLYPPIHCGTKPPDCTRVCTRNHPCDHEVRHTCHSDATCPPCTSLTVKWCYGHHKQCSSVMCFMDGVSCGMPCLKDLPCGNHKCKVTCHPGECLKPQTKCTQACTVPRPTCGHPCGNQCHEGPCPETPCKAQVTLSCPCGHRSETSTCYDSTKSYHLMSVSVLATKMQEIKDGQSVNLNEVLGKKSKSAKLQCNEECAIIERNKRLAVALQIQNPDLSTSPGPPNYSDFLKTEAKKNPAFVSNVHDKIGELVQLAKESKQKCRSYSFPPMNRDQRRVVHELAEFFGCETQSYDEEPKKNVVVTAHKNKCWLPFVSVMTVVLKDMGLRKGPAPVLAQRQEPKNVSSSVTLAQTSTQKKKIDYFDYNA